MRRQKDAQWIKSSLILKKKWQLQNITSYRFNAFLKHTSTIWDHFTVKSCTFSSMPPLHLGALIPSYRSFHHAVYLVFDLHYGHLDCWSFKGKLLYSARFLCQQGMCICNKQASRSVRDTSHLEFVYTP